MAATVTTEERQKTLQIRRPNKLFQKPLKKNLALLFDILGFNFYVNNPKDSEFKISWVELERNYNINTRNKQHIKAKLTELQDMKYISHLKMWNNGFSYRFENTFLTLEELKKPTTWTFLDFNLMQKLDTISYKLYVLAYKFYDFTDDRKLDFKNQTKFIEINEFLELFNSKSEKIEYSKNRIIALVRNAIENLKKNFNIEIEMFLKKFGRPIIAIKFKFHKVPKLKEIASRFVDLTVQKTKRTYKKFKKVIQENWVNISKRKRTDEHLDMIRIAQQHTMKKFLAEELFPKIAKSAHKELQKTKEFILKKFYVKDNDSFNIDLNKAEFMFKNYKQKNSFKKMREYGIFEDIKFSEVTRSLNKTLYWKNGNHPVLPTIKGDIIIFEETDMFEKIENLSSMEGLFDKF